MSLSPKCRISNEWLSRKDAQGNIVSSWAKKKDDTHITCLICLSTFSCEKAGFQAIQQHVRTAKHTDKAKEVLHPSQLRLAASSHDQCLPQEEKNSHPPLAYATTSAASSPVVLTTSSEAAVRAELKWVLKCVFSNLSARSCDNIADLFRSMFPVGFPEGFSLGRTKFGYYLTEALGPYFRKELLADLCNAKYTLCFDETTNSQGFKELQVSVRYWSDAERQIVFSHLETFFIGRATAEILSNHLLLAIQNADLSLREIITVSCDGPNVNKAVFSLISAEVKKERGCGIVDLGSCNLHVIHNAFQKGLLEFGLAVSDLACKIFSFFDGWPARWELYSEIQESLKVPSHHFVKHLPVRWLTLAPAAERLIEQWPALQKYFLREVSMSGSSYNKNLVRQKTFQDIVQALKDPCTKAEVCFFFESAKIFQKYLAIFQLEQPMIHVLHEEMTALNYTLMGRICTPEAMAAVDCREPFNQNNLLPLKDLHCGEQTEVSVKGLKEVDQLAFRLNVQKHFKAASQYLMDKSVLRKTVAKYFSCLKPSNRNKEESKRNIVKIARLLGLEVSQSSLHDEWRLLQLEELPGDNDVRIDHLWRNVFALKTSTGDTKYPTIVATVKAALSVAHGSADVERGFSTSGNILTSNTPRVAVRTLNAKLNTRNMVRKYEQPERVPITPDLVLGAKFACSKYKEFLENEKREKQKLEAQSMEDEEKERRRLEEEKAQNKAGKELEKLEKKYKEAKKEEVKHRSAADKLLEEANERLKKALKKKNMEDIQIAQGLLEGAKKIRKGTKEKEEANDKTLKKIEAKKSDLIAYLKKTNN